MYGIRVCFQKNLNQTFYVQDKWLFNGKFKTIFFYFVNNSIILGSKYIYLLKKKYICIYNICI